MAAKKRLASLFGKATSGLRSSRNIILKGPKQSGKTEKPQFQSFA